VKTRRTRRTLVKSHHDIYQDASLYDAQNATLTKDIRFYHQLAQKQKGPVLELGVGTGRVALPIARDGISFTGLDASAAMLSRARERLSEFKAHCRLVRGNYARFKVAGRFALIFSAFNALQHAYGWREMLGVFQCARRHLKSGGIFAFDLFNPRYDWLKDSEKESHMRERFYDERSRQACELWETYDYDRATQIKLCHWEYRWERGEIRRVELKIRVYFPEEILELLDRTGLRVTKRFGDFDGGSFNSISPKQVLLCRTQ